MKTMFGITADLPRLETPRIAPRAKLIPLVPGGLGTATCESLTSYLHRLALAHCLSTFDLAWYVIGTTLGKHALPKAKESRMPWREQQMSGVGEVPKRWARAIALLNHRHDLEQLTLAPWCEVLPPRLLISRKERWCPACFEQAKSDGSAPYLQLIWDVGAVEACPIHQVTLSSACPHCGPHHTRTKVVSTVPGYCSYCGAWIGQPAERCAAATAAQVRNAEQVGALIAASVSHSADASRTALRHVLKTGINQFFSGYAARLGDAVGQPKNSVHMWLVKGTLPSLPSLVRIAEVMRIPLLDLVTGNVDALGSLSPSSAGEIRTRARVKRAAPRKLDWPAIETRLRELHGVWPPLTTAAIARDVGVDYRTLHQHLAPLVREISKRRDEYTSEQARQRTAAKVSLVREAAFSLMAQGLRPKATLMVKALQGKLPFAGKVVWDAWKAVCDKPLPEGWQPAGDGGAAQSSAASTQNTTVSGACADCTLDE